MSAIAISLLPPKAAERLQAFLVDGRTGSLELHIKDGNVLAWKIIEQGNG